LESFVQQIPLKKIFIGNLQPRKSFPHAELAELIASVKEKGVLQPVLVRPIPNGYELIAGERRYRAAREAGLSQIPALVRKLSDREALEAAIIENIQRTDLNPIELAEGYSRLMIDFSMSQEQVADRVGKDRTTVANTIRLLRLPEQIRHALVEGKITAGHARALLSVPTEHVISIFDTVLRRELSVREVELLCKREAGKDARKAKPQVEDKESNGISMDIHMKDLEERMSRRRGTRVRLQGDANTGKVELYYFSSGELERLLELLLS